METFTLVRTATGEQGTPGILHAGTIPLCTTWEDQWLKNANNISCIPAGTYLVKPHTGKHYKNVWAVQNVPGRTGILIHNGNTELDTEGCILVGNGFSLIKDGLCGVINSMATLERLRRLLPQTFTLVIVDQFSGVSGKQ